MKKLLTLVSLGSLALFSAANAQTLYDITFTGGDWSASGQIDVLSGVATSGYLDVTYQSTTIDYDYLATGSGIIKDNNGDNLPTGDNLVSLTAVDPFDQNGLLFVQTPINGNGNSPAGMYLSADQDNGYVPNLNGYGNAPAGFGYDNPLVDGTVTLTAVPEPATMSLLAGGLFGLLALRRRKA